MALIVEIGSGIANANSYGDIDADTTKTNAIAFAADRGITISALVIEQYLINGTDYIETFRDRFVGSVVDVLQSLSWPRKCVKYPDGSDFPEDELPENLIKALYQTCIEQQNGIVLIPSYEGERKTVIEEKVDVIETRYSPKIITDGMPVMPLVDAYLKGLLKPTPALRNYRV
jgi:hypothetical protein